MKMNHKTRRAITEASRIYELLEDTAKSQVPVWMVEFLMKHRDPRMGRRIKSDLPLQEQRISNEGWNVIARMVAVTTQQDDHEAAAAREWVMQLSA